MKNYLNRLKTCKLFNDISEDNILKALTCLKGNIKEYNKNDIIYLAGDEINNIGVVLSGSVSIIKDDIMGNRNILDTMSESELFGETFVFSNFKHIPVTIEANENCEILFVQFKQLTEVCQFKCDFHNTLIQNMLDIISNKNILLYTKIEILSAKTTRLRLITYLNKQMKKNKSNTFTIPFNRDDLANYLNLDRSSMSRELSKMRDEGIIKFNKDKFKILI